MTWEEYKANGIPGRLEAALKNENPTVVTRLESGFVVLGDSQMLPAYCVLLAYPVVESLEALPLQKHLIFLRDMTMLGKPFKKFTKQTASIMVSSAITTSTFTRMFGRATLTRLKNAAYTPCGFIPKKNSTH